LLIFQFSLISNKQFFGFLQGLLTLLEAEFAFDWLKQSNVASRNGKI